MNRKAKPHAAMAFLNALGILSAGWGEAQTFERKLLPKTGVWVDSSNVTTWFVWMPRPTNRERLWMSPSPVLGWPWASAPKPNNYGFCDRYAVTKIHRVDGSNVVQMANDEQARPG
jgi:hypothetical protein